MSARLDVLDVLERAAREATPLAFALEIDNARNAVAELIAAATQLQADSLPYADGRLSDTLGQSRTRLLFAIRATRP